MFTPSIRETIASLPHGSIASLPYDITPYILGKGYTATVYRGSWYDDEEDVESDASTPIAVKLYHSYSLRHRKDAFEHERAIWAHLGFHPAIVTYLGSNATFLQLYMELGVGSLDAWFAAPRSPRWSSYTDRMTTDRMTVDRMTMGRTAMDIVSSWCYDLYGGLQHMHAHHVLHNDLRFANIVLCTFPQVKWIDFNTSVHNESHTHEEYQNELDEFMDHLCPDLYQTVQSWNPTL